MQIEIATTDSSNDRADGDFVDALPDSDFQVRAGDQSQSRKGTRHRGAANAASARRRGIE
jgi:hypothetical protein